MARTDHQSVTQRIQRLNSEFKTNADPIKAQQNQAYLKTDQPMFGIAAAPRKKMMNEVLKTIPVINQDDYNQSILSFWQQPQREFQYCAHDLAIKYKKFLNPDAWPIFEEMAFTAKWWDLTDGVSVNLIGGVLLQDRSYQKSLNNWSQDPDLWLRRTSLLAHLKHKGEAEFGQVENTILTICPDRQFFIQKAIGWILREYSKSHADWVVTFLDEHHEKLAPLAIKEGRKYL